MELQNSQVSLPPATVGGRQVRWLGYIRLANPIAYALALFTLLTAPVLALSWRARPFPGFVVEQTQVVSDYKGPGWSGWEAGLRYPQRIRRLDGMPVESAEILYETLSTYRLGDTVAIDTVQPSGEALHYPTIELTTFPGVDFFRLFVLPYVVAWFYLAIGIWVLAMRWQTRAGRAFAYFSASSALVIGLLFDLITTHTFSAVWVIAIAQIGGGMFSLGLLFPQEWPLVKRLDGLHYLPYALSTGLAIWGLAVMNSQANPWAYIWSWRASYIYAALGIAAFLVLMAYRYLTSASKSVRQQARLILIGSLIAFGPLAAWLGAPLFNLFPHWNPVIFLPLLLAFPISIAIAILRYQLWDMDIILNRTLVYGLLTVLLGVIYITSVLIMQQVFIAVTGERSQLAVAGATLVITLLFNPMRRGVQDFIDRRLYRRKYNIAATLAAFGERLRDEVDLTRIVQQLEEVIWTTIQPTYVLVWLHSGKSFKIAIFNENDPQYQLADLHPELREVPEVDPIPTFLLNARSAVMAEWIETDSPLMPLLEEARAKLIVPIISQAELIGWICMGPRLSQQVYTLEDRNLLTNLSFQAAPALRFAQLVRQQQVEARQRELLDHELRLARTIQQALLPKRLPNLPDWKIATHYQPARAVGGDFYDFFEFEDGRLGLIIGDVTDKGIPAAMVMATTRTLFRAVAQENASPGVVLARVNSLLVEDIPRNMFVTCLYAILDPISGRVTFANAGHNLPLLGNIGMARELRATGMPLGLMADAVYEDMEATIAANEYLVLYSDGLVEAHDTRGEMYGIPRLRLTLAEQASFHDNLVHCLLQNLNEFTGADWEQEDDVTLVILRRTAQRGEEDDQPTA